MGIMIINIKIRMKIRFNGFRMRMKKIVPFLDPQEGAGGWSCAYHTSGESVVEEEGFFPLPNPYQGL